MAKQVADLADQVESLQAEIVTNTSDRPELDRTEGLHTGKRIEQLRSVFKDWFDFYHEYDPLFSWWVEAPFERAETALRAYGGGIRSRFGGGRRDRDAIVGVPIGREALLAELRHEMIPYSPEQLMVIAEREFAWCEQRMIQAADDLGYGDDWREALEHVKQLYVEPGQQPKLIHDLAVEAVAYLEARDLITIPELAKQTWRMEMMSAERQRVSPFFLGGEVIIISYPTSTMTHEEKMMSMRGNNPHFSRATVQHELIPGHHLQQFMTSRYRTDRQFLGTPFWTEGWALYWEMRLWDLGFPRGPEDRIGMLFWRMHRCARILFSLGYHLGTMTPEQAIDLLVDRVGHERKNAEAEVRRSVQGGYSPLYQCAYLVGGLQFRALHDELVVNGPMTERQFHDTILRLNRIPVEMIRASLKDDFELTPDYVSSWKFYGDVATD